MMPRQRDAATPGRHVAVGSPADRKPLLWAGGLFLAAAAVFGVVLLAFALH